MNKYLWMAVTPDELELPMAVADTARELTAMFGLKAIWLQKSIAFITRANSKIHTNIRL